MIASTEPKRMVGDLEQRIVALQEAFSILAVCEVEPQHGGAKVDAPSMEDAMGHGMA